MKFYVYELIDPLTNRIFYIGKGQKKRMYNHVKNVQRGKMPNNNKHLYFKIKKILDSKLKVKYKKIFETKNEYDALKKEIELIKEIGLKNLCNLTFGGDGTTGHKHTAEIKKYLSDKKIKYFADQKNRNKMSILLKKQYSKMTKQEREKRFGNNKGKKQWNYGVKGYKLHSKSKRISDRYLDIIINLRTQGLSYEKIAIIISEKEKEKIGWWIIRTLINERMV